MAATHPERVAGVVAINPGLNLSPPHPHRVRGRFGFDDEPQSDEGWALENRHHWLRDWRRFTEFFFGEMFPEPHSTKQHEDCVEWSLEIGPETMLAGWGASADIRADPAAAEDVCRRVRCPVLVINGDQDMCQPPARSHRVAELTGGDLVVLEGRRPPPPRPRPGEGQPGDRPLSPRRLTSADDRYAAHDDRGVTMPLTRTAFPARGRRRRTAISAPPDNVSRDARTMRRHRRGAVAGSIVPVVSTQRRPPAAAHQQPGGRRHRSPRIPAAREP